MNVIVLSMRIHALIFKKFCWKMINGVLNLNCRNFAIIQLHSHDHYLIYEIVTKLLVQQKDGK